MKCMSCKRERGTKFFNRILLCGGCLPLAEKAQSEMLAEIARAREVAGQWLEQHIMQGGLLRGGDGGAQHTELLERLTSKKE